MIFNFGEFFSGPGGLALGASQAELIIDEEKWAVQHSWANDIDKDACSTYEKNIIKNNNAKIICSPVQELNIRLLPDIQAFGFGFPCNDFSLVGEQNGLKGKFGPLYSYGVQVLAEKNPLWFFAENVSGLRSSDEGRTLKKILYDLSTAGMGYETTPHLYKFEEYAVPQARHRIIIIGIRKDQNLKFEVPAPIYNNPKRYITAKTALEEPPIPSDAENNEITNQNIKVIERLKKIPPGENAWYKKLPEDLRLKVKGAKLSQIYRRLDPNKPSYTITGSGGGGTHGYHWEEPRALTNRERARLQTFPDNFVFIGGKESVRKQIGMAVPPLAAKIIVQSIFKTFAGVKYESISSFWD